ncbi:MAG: hypothetical protein KatS3mg035_0337 [Bacteroidia bacterium]|nr:MAG: hypothetical protein KatS3mg035_0337 [Bacteroidia bacterium]
MEPKVLEALKKYLFQLADDELIIGHRNSEWTGLGPILEEDIAFASMAQDEIGHAQAFYLLLHELGEQDPDTLAFYRSYTQFRCCQLVEYPIGEYDFSLVRHFLYDVQEMLRLRSLSQSKYEPLAHLASKLIREEKYHYMHAVTWFQQLSNGSEEARIRIQNALNFAFPLALSLFETCDYHSILVQQEIIVPEQELENQWIQEVRSLAQKNSYYHS